MSEVMEEKRVKKYPIAEIFTSPQGEGLYSGTLMTFVRIAGCSVGKPMTGDERTHFSNLEQKDLALYREKCTLYDGRTFACDTNFQTSEAITAAEIMSRIPDGVEHMCITGGEPLNHDITDLMEAAYDKVVDVHIETSGTVSLKRSWKEFKARHLIGDSVSGWVWITVSPKKGCLDMMIGLASELKLLVDEDFDISKVPSDWLNKSLVYIQAVNGEHTINRENVNRCLQLQRQYPHLKISNQNHKNWGVR